MLDARQALIFVNRWKDSHEHREAFATLAGRAEALLNVAQALNAFEDVQPLLPYDIYRSIDLRIIADLRDALVSGKIPPGEVRQRAEARGQLHWARHDPSIQSLYRALAAAAELLERLPKLDLTIESFDAGIQKYAATWWQVDQLYRKFIHHSCESGQTALLEQLAQRIEGLYINEFVGKLAQRWQEWVDRCAVWSSSTIPVQREFFPRFVQSQTAEGRKLFVVISDALRYEAAVELQDRIRREDRWTAEIKPAVGVLPSFTQLGMAALLSEASPWVCDRPMEKPLKGRNNRPPLKRAYAALSGL
jgi:hypothetical protein